MRVILLCVDLSSFFQTWWERKLSSFLSVFYDRMLILSSKRTLKKVLSSKKENQHSQVKHLFLLSSFSLPTFAQLLFWIVMSKQVCTFLQCNMLIFIRRHHTIAHLREKRKMEMLCYVQTRSCLWSNLLSKIITHRWCNKNKNK